MRTAFALALAAGMLLAAGASGADAAQDATERANVRKIHERIVAQSARRPAKPVHTRSRFQHHGLLRHGADPGRRIHHGLGPPKKDEQPQHKVRVDAFWMQAHEVTWDEYRLFMFASQGGEIAHKDEVVDAVSRPTRPYVEMSFGMGIDGFPAISMTQHAANKYAEWLSARTGEFYRLPTEAEWEYACRAGTTGRLPSPLGRLRLVCGQQRG